MAICQWERMVNNWGGRKWRQIFVQKIHTENSEKISIQSFPCYSSSEFLHTFFHSEIFFYFIFAHILKFDHHFWFAPSFPVSFTISTCVGWSSTLKMEEADSSNTLMPVNHVMWRHMLAKCNFQLTVICKRIFRFVVRWTQWIAAERNKCYEWNDRADTHLFDRTYTFSDRLCSWLRRWISSHRKWESMSLAELARTWTSVTGIRTWYRMISTSLELLLLVTPCCNKSHWIWTMSVATCWLGIPYEAKLMLYMCVCDPVSVTTPLVRFSWNSV